MAYLSSLFQKVSGPDEVQEAMINAICMATSGGGQPTRANHEFACVHVAEMLALTEDEAADYVDESFERIEEEGVEGVIEQIADDIVHQEDRAAIYQAAVFVRSAEGHLGVEPSEDELLSLLAAALDLTVDEVEELSAEAVSGFEAYAADETFDAGGPSAYLQEDDDDDLYDADEDDEEDEFFGGGGSEDDGLIGEEF